MGNVWFLGDRLLERRDGSEILSGDCVVAIEQAMRGILTEGVWSSAMKTLVYRQES